MFIFVYLCDAVKQVGLKNSGSIVSWTNLHQPCTQIGEGKYHLRKTTILRLGRNLFLSWTFFFNRIESLEATYFSWTNRQVVSVVNLHLELPVDWITWKQRKATKKLFKQVNCNKISNSECKICFFLYYNRSSTKTHIVI